MSSNDPTLTQFLRECMEVCSLEDQEQKKYWLIQRYKHQASYRLLAQGMDLREKGRKLLGSELVRSLGRSPMKTVNSALKVCTFCDGTGKTRDLLLRPRQCPHCQPPDDQFTGSIFNIKPDGYKPWTSQSYKASSLCMGCALEKGLRKMGLEDTLDLSKKRCSCE